MLKVFYWYPLTLYTWPLAIDNPDASPPNFHVASLSTLHDCSIIQYFLCTVCSAATRTCGRNLRYQISTDTKGLDITGSVTVNGQPMSKSFFLENAAYVPQEDRLWSALTGDRYFL